MTRVMALLFGSRVMGERFRLSYVWWAVFEPDGYKWSDIWGPYKWPKINGSNYN